MSEDTHTQTHSLLLCLYPLLVFSPFISRSPPPPPVLQGTRGDLILLMSGSGIRRLFWFSEWVCVAARALFTLCACVLSFIDMAIVRPGPEWIDFWSRLFWLFTEPNFVPLESSECHHEKPRSTRMQNSLYSVFGHTTLRISRDPMRRNPSPLNNI